MKYSDKMKTKYTYLRIRLTILFSLLFYFSNNAQILDVPYRNDITSVCNDWCWAKSTHMIVTYYGDNVNLCDVLEEARQLYPSIFGTVNCCVNPGQCCNPLSPANTIPVLNAFSISSSYHPGELSLSEVYDNLSSNRPFIILVYGHVVVGYGLSNNDIYYHDPGNGSQIRDYDDFIQAPYLNGRWIGTTIMNDSATTCLLTQDISGSLNSTNSIYKARNLINAKCNINSNSNVEFRCEKEVLLDSGFEVQLGSSLSIETGVNLICP